ncbi:hypothetical protein RHSIM_Rhsim02G0075100 [Rhododendron simsii]|uniref:Non-specific serine/threonine protein kinase n=1 Tax=Rhododendron simsii TaxID=118357 RepID=A0A834LZM1_RHOSS|nr:hypothetical protein RHSIM_Rhsim02G0075100 [Rhododendron simsii]
MAFPFSPLLIPLLLLHLTTASSPLPHSLSPNFTASYLELDNNSNYGAFLATGPFSAAMTNTSYLAVVHTASDAIVWSASRSSLVPSIDATIRLTATGLYIEDHGGEFVWSTPPFSSPVSLLQLQEFGNLVLLDRFNRSLWESFDYPTDTILIGQRLHVGQSLVSAIADQNLSMGDYRFTVTDDGGGDAVMTWNGLTYWKLSTDTRAYKVSNLPASYMVLNETGLFLFGGNNSVVVIQLTLGVSEFRIAKLDYNGRFSIKNYDSSRRNSDTSMSLEEFSGPVDECLIPNICSKIGVCSAMPVPASSSFRCSCPLGFNFNNQTNEGCLPVYDSLPSACNASGNGDSNVSTSYLKLEDGMDYFLNDFSEPRVRGVNLFRCEHLCSLHCSCLGLFHDNSSGSCYLLENLLGSIIANSTTDRTGYIKALRVSTSAGPYGKNGSRRSQPFPIAGLVLLPSSGFLLITLVVVGVVWYRKRKSGNSSLGLEKEGIPGLPVRFGFKELVAATENFRTKIGSGGFGTVFKGTLLDESAVAVKKITSLGVEGKREFCTEIATIGNIRHVNLVRLKGFCTQGRQRFLVYEYMNKGSLDRVLFGNGYVLEWEERFKIALGTARGLAYLHSSCEQKIIHCDVKPENILLDDNLQVKTSDFGISKLLSREQSGLFTTMRGTRGYIAPDWLSNSAITDKSDVYSCGMVLLEIVRGRKNWSLQIHNGNTENDQSPLEHSIFFPLYALEMHKQRRYLELVDPRLEGRVTSEEEVEKLVRVALCCVHQDPTLRPSMVNVVGMLEGRYPVGVPRVESLRFLPFFGPRRTAVPRIEAHNVQNGLVLFSYMSSQQLSGASPDCFPIRTIFSLEFLLQSRDHLVNGGGKHLEALAYAALPRENSVKEKGTQLVGKRKRGKRREQRRYLELADPRLEGRVKSEEEVEKLVRVALYMLRAHQALRSSMANVVGMLEGRYPVGVPQVESLSLLLFFGKRRTEVPRIEAHNVENGLVLFPQANASSNCSSRGSCKSFSYMSSQHVSGPSYGMVLLEIVRGRKNWSLQRDNGNTENDQSSLEHSIFFPLYALEMHKQRRYLELVDPRVEGRVTSEEEVEKLVRAALCCVHQDPTLRPSVANVVGMLEGRYPVGVPWVESLRFLPFFGQRRMEVPRIEAHNVHNGLVLFSYTSSQQVSGAR